MRHCWYSCESQRKAAGKAMMLSWPTASHLVTNESAFTALLGSSAEERITLQLVLGRGKFRQAEREGLVVGDI